MTKPTAIDLFCGCGGMGLGLHNAGYEVVYANDINEDAIKTYKHNLKNTLAEQGDITKINPNDVTKKIKRKRVDVIVAGTPCQGFSTSGKRNPNDPRNKLFKQLVKFVDAFQPKIFVMENVSGLLSMKEGNTFDRIKESFEKLGYFVEYEVLSASNYGIPQNRNRVLIVGTKKKISKNKLFPQKRWSLVTVEDAISDLCDLGIGEKQNKYKKPAFTEYQKLMRKKSRKLLNHESAKHSAKVQSRFARIPQGVDGRKVLKKSDTKKRDIYRLHPYKESRTITTLPEDFIHYEKNRIPTVRELARIQSFPDHFEFLGPRTTGGKQRVKSCPQYTQVGNAVPPLLAKFVFEQIRKIL